MLIDLKTRLDEPAIREILEYSVYADADKLNRTIEAYREDAGLELFGLDEEGEIIGLIGLRMQVSGELTIEHMAVSPDFRGLGYGRGLILEAIDKKSPSVVIAETDEESVDFYRNIGFEIESLGELYPGTERFRCIFEV